MQFRMYSSAGGHRGTGVKYKYVQVRMNTNLDFTLKQESLHFLHQDIIFLNELKVFWVLVKTFIFAMTKGKF